LRKGQYSPGTYTVLVDDDLAAFRAAALSLLDRTPDLSLAALEAEHDSLGGRLERFGDCRDALDIWERLGIAEPERLPILDTATFLATVSDKRA
jgi:malonate decarboxylase beta subunit